MLPEPNSSDHFRKSPRTLISSAGFAALPGGKLGSPDIESFGAVVIGSGFGGTIAALTLANSFEESNTGREKKDWEEVCILERGQWWISHEIPFTPKDARAGKPNMREYLQDNGEPHGFWAHPDNIEGIFRLGSMARQVSKSGLYDYRMLSDRVHAITASGVGGGSLVYSNVTLRPHESIYRNWPTQREGRGIEEYFAPAEGFIGVNRITTIAGLSNQKLGRSKLFQEAARAAKAGHGNIINTDEEGYDLNLSITDVPDGLFGDLTPAKIEKYKSPDQTNVCQRQARCNLGCLPGARHTLNKKLFRALMKGKPLRVKALCEASLVTFREGDSYPYKVLYKQYTAKGASFVRKELQARKLVVCAGTLGTTELLKKSSAKGLKVSAELGKGFSTDGDLLGYMTLEGREVDNTRGPINTSHAMFRTPNKEFAFSIEDTAIPPMVAPFFATLLELMPQKRRGLPLSRKLSLLRRYPLLGLSLLFSSLSLSDMQNILTKIWRDPKIQLLLRNLMKAEPVQDPNRLCFAYQLVNSLFTNAERPFASAADRLARFFIFSCMGVDNADGVLGLRPEWENLEQNDLPAERLMLNWSPQSNKDVFSDIIRGMKELADKIEPGGSQQVQTPTWNEAAPDQSTLILLHPLGGCRMADDIDHGVVNSYGQVFMPDGEDKKKVYPNFYLLDGSVMPSALGVNSSLAIMAVALRGTERMVGDTKYWPA